MSHFSQQSGQALADDFHTRPSSESLRFGPNKWVLRYLNFTVSPDRHGDKDPENDLALSFYISQVRL